MTDVVNIVMGAMVRLDLEDEKVGQRVESREYRALVKRIFRAWSGTESEEKRTYVRKLLCHAADPHLKVDDLLRLFADWIHRYDDLHFRVIRAIHACSGCTRAEIWDEIHGQAVREDSTEADLFKLLINDLSLGQVIRQERNKDGAGKFYRAQRTPKTATPYLKSAFDDDKGYELTSLGRQFVHYLMDEVVPKLS